MECWVSASGEERGEAEAPTFGTGWTWIQTWTWNAARCHGDLKGRGWSHAAQFNIFKCRGQKQRSAGLFLESVCGGVFLSAFERCALGRGRKLAKLPRRGEALQDGRPRPRSSKPLVGQDPRGVGRWCSQSPGLRVGRALGQGALWQEQGAPAPQVSPRAPLHLHSQGSSSPRARSGPLSGVVWESGQGRTLLTQGRRAGPCAGFLGCLGLGRREGQRKSLPGPGGGQAPGHH